MLQAGFETDIPNFERPKTVIDLDRSATETGKHMLKRSVKFGLKLYH
jgi:hypothetical protein